MHTDKSPPFLTILLNNSLFVFALHKICWFNEHFQGYIDKYIYGLEHTTLIKIWVLISEYNSQLPF